MKMEEILTESILLAKAFSPTLALRLSALKDDIHRSGLKIVVMGDFKTGKSTLINRVFLKKDLLPVEYKEATAVPTRIREGALRMLAYKPGEKQAAVDLAEVDADTLAGYITAPSDKARAALAEQFSYIELSIPGVLPEGITIVDTPGLNTTNASVMRSTEEEARSADGIIYVTRAATLSMSELESIRSFSGNQLQKFPLHVVLTAEPTQAPWQVEEVRREIEAQLGNEGISARCSAFHFAAPTQRGLFRSETAAIAPGTPSGGLRRRFGHAATAAAACPAEAVADGGAEMNARMKSTLENFIQNEVAPGRMARVARELKPLLERLLIAMESKLSTVDKSAEQMAERHKTLLRKKMEYESVVEDLLSDIRKAQLVYKQAVGTMLEELQKKCEEDLANAGQLGGVWNVIETMQQSFASHIAGRMELLTLDFQTDVRKIGARYELDLRKKLNMGTDAGDVNLNLGFLAKIPGWLVTALDYVLVVATSPLPWYLDIPARMLAGKISFLKKILPAEIASEIVKVKVIDMVKKALVSMRTDIETRLDSQFGKCLAALQAELLENPELNGALGDAGGESCAQMSSDEKLRLQNGINSVRNWIEEV